MNIESKSYQLENLERKLPNEIDGLNIAKRKSLYGAMFI